MFSPAQFRSSSQRGAALPPFSTARPPAFSGPARVKLSATAGGLKRIRDCGGVLTGWFRAMAQFSARCRTMARFLHEVDIPPED